MVVAASLVACERRELSNNRDVSPIVARVDGSILSRDAFDHFLPEDYENTLTREEVRDYLDRWLITELLYNEAMRTGEGVPSDLDTRLERYKKDLVADYLVQKIILERAVVSEAEIRAFYQAHEQEYLKEYRVSHILVNTREEARKVQEQLGKRGFTYLARRYSIDKHSGSGGDLGYLSKGNMIPEFEDIIFGMQVGDVSGIIESEFGYHLMTVTEIRNARYFLSYEEVKHEIAADLALVRRDAVYDSLITELRARADVTIADAALEFLAVELDSLPSQPTEGQ